MNEPTDTPTWVADPSPLHMLKDGESAVVRGWKIRVDKIKPFRLSSFAEGLFSSLTEQEQKVLDMGKDPAELERKERRIEGEKSHPYQWSVEKITDGRPSTFSHMGGRAETLEIAKKIAGLSVALASYSSIALEPNKWKGPAGQTT